MCSTPASPWTQRVWLHSSTTVRTVLLVRIPAYIPLRSHWSSSNYSLFHLLEARPQADQALSWPVLAAISLYPYPIHFIGSFLYFGLGILQAVVYLLAWCINVVSKKYMPVYATRYRAIPRHPLPLGSVGYLDWAWYILAQARFSTVGYREEAWGGW